MDIKDSAERFTTMKTDEGYYVFDNVDQMLVGDPFPNSFQAEVQAIRRNRWPHIQREVIDAILKERRRQDEQRGPQLEHSSGYWLAIATKKLGDAASALLKPEDQPRERDLEKELTEAAAVLVAWLEDIARNR